MTKCFGVQRWTDSKRATPGRGGGRERNDKDEMREGGRRREQVAGQQRHYWEKGDGVKHMMNRRSRRAVQERKKQTKHLQTWC